MKQELAILGGEPVRKKPFPEWPIIGESEINAVVNVLKSGKLSTFAASSGKLFFGGEKIREFEKRFAEYHGIKHAIAVNSATAGLHCALAACGVGPGVEVIVPSYTFTATATSVLHHNGVPVFADVDKKTYCIDPEDIRKKITSNTKVIVPVHLLGHPAEMDEIMKIAKNYNLKVIEDCAQSPGAKYKEKLVGTIGNLGVFSFQETKNMMTGEGGMIITDDDALAHKCRMIRNHGEAIVEGQKREYLSNIVGWNYRMTEMEAAIGIEQLKKLDYLNNERRRLAEFLSRELSKIEGIEIPYVDKKVHHVYHVYGMLYDEKVLGVKKDVFMKAINAEGIPLSGGYPRPLYLNPVFLQKIAYGDAGCPFTCPYYKGKIAYSKGDCPVAEDLCENKAIWLFAARPPATVDDMQDIVDAFKKVVSNRDELKKIM